MINQNELKWLLSDIKGKSIFKLKDVHNDRLRIKDGIYFKLDIKSYYENTKIYKVINFFKNKLQMSPDCVAILIKILTMKNKKDKNFIVRGFSHSGLLAFFANIDFFLEVNNFCKKNNLSFSLYVDDMFFVGENVEIYEWAKEQIIKMAKKHNIKINYGKTKMNKINKGIYYHKLFLKNGVLHFNKNKSKKRAGYLKQISRFNASW